ncbi:MAG: hypothetical protein QM756_24180 [Polyangiaceae bacterium]
MARHRYDLTCSLAQGHSGAHRDDARGEEWQAAPGQLKTLLRDENE